MADAGRRKTDAEFRRLQAKIKRVYLQAYGDMYRKNADFIKRHEKKEARYRAMVDAGKLSKADFKAWMRGQVFQGQQWENRKKQMRETLLHADQIAMEMVNDSRFNVFANNANYIGYELEQHGRIDSGFGLYDENTVRRLLIEEPDLLPPRKVGKDKSYQWYNRTIQNAVTQGIIQGEKLYDIAKRIAQATGETSMNAMLRNARTMHTGAENAGRIEGLHQAQRLGIKVKKKWLAFLDNHTRDSHRALDGKTAEVDEPFKSPLGKIMFPGDPNAESPADVWNCFVGDTNVASDSEIIRSYKHDYSGELITVETASGVKFTCTPNHPILTPFGWIGANRLHKGDNVIIANVGEAISKSEINPDIDHTFPSFDALHKFCEMTFTERATGLSVNFHGDRATSNVEVVSKKRFLWYNRNVGGSEFPDKLILKNTASFVLAKGHFVSRLRRIHISALRLMRRACKSLPFLRSSTGHTVVHGFGTVTRRNSVILKAQNNGVSGDIEFLCQCLDRFPCKIFVDNIINIKVSTVSHVPVFNLQTGNGYYFVNNIIPQKHAKCNGNFAIAHNCRCTLIYDYPEYPDSMAQRRDALTGALVAAMSYKEWEAMKQGEGTTEPVAESKIDKTVSMYASAMQGASNAAEFWMNMDADQMEAFNASGENIYDLYNRLKDSVSAETLELPEWKPDAPGGIENYALFHDYSGHGIQVNEIAARSEGWMAGAETTGIINVRNGGFDEWQYIIGHEAGHQLANYNPELQRIIVDNPGGLLGRYNQKRGFFDGAFGEYNAEEAWADAVSAYVNSPQNFSEQYPKLYRAVDSFFKTSPSALDFVNRALASYRKAVGK